MLPEARGIEVLIVFALALIVVGPKEMPNLLRKLGQFVGKMRNIANDFRASFDEMARQSELDDLRKQVEEMRHQAVQATSYDHTGLTDAISQFNAGPSVPEPEPQPAPVPEAKKRAPRKKTVETPVTPAKASVRKTPATGSPKATAATSIAAKPRTKRTAAKPVP